MAAVPNFRIESFESGSETTIKLAGELDSATCTELLDRFAAALNAAGTREVIVDLTDVSFIDSAGMRAMVVIERDATERGVALTVVPAPAAVTDLLRVTGVADHVKLAPRSGEVPRAEPFIERVDLPLVRDPSAPGRARAELRDALRGRVSAAVQDTATLLTSELVTNAVIHPPENDTPIGLRITAYADRVRVEVTDPGSGFDVANLEPPRDRPGGHGLFVVEGLSSRWGTAPAGGGDGFCVWFELDLAAEDSDAPEQSGAAARVGASGG